MADSDKTKLPEPDAKDVVTKIFNAGVKAVPFVGGPLSELMSIVIVPSLDRRRKVWLENIAVGLMEVQEKLQNFIFEDLLKNEKFTTAFMHATASAMKNHQKEKLDALRNAVLNSFSINAPDEDLQLIFINSIDSMTQWHLRILKFFYKPTEWKKENISYDINSSIEQYFYVIFPDLEGKFTFCRKIVNDLNADGLIKAGGLFLDVSSKDAFSTRTTDIGEAFIKFITKPF